LAVLRERKGAGLLTHLRIVGGGKDFDLVSLYASPNWHRNNQHGREQQSKSLSQRDLFLDAV
jgi:hypothetical protein